MHVPINVKYPNNISEWQMRFNSAFKGLMMFHMMCIKCVMKVARTFKKYITYIVTLYKMNKISVWFSTCIFSCYALSWNFYIFLVS